MKKLYQIGIWLRLKDNMNTELTFRIEDVSKLFLELREDTEENRKILVEKIYEISPDVIDIKFEYNSEYFSNDVIVYLNGDISIRYHWF